MSTSITLSPGSVVWRETGIDARRIKDETLMISLKTNRCYALDAVGTEIWERLERPISVVNLCVELYDIFDVKPDICLREVSNLIETLAREELVKVVRS